MSAEEEKDLLVNEDTPTVNDENSHPGEPETPLGPEPLDKGEDSLDKEEAKSPADESSSPPSEEGPDPSLVEGELEKAVQEREALIAQLQAEREKVDAEAQQLTDEIKIKEQSALDFSVWVDRHRRTFLWKMFAKMREQVHAVKAQQESYASFMKSIELPKPGELVRLRKRFHKTILQTISAGLLVWLVYFLITTYLPFAWVAQLSAIGGNILRYTISVIVVSLFSALILYYRDWRRFDWRVRNLNTHLSNVAEGVDKVRHEEVRLFSLYPQVRDWLEIMGYSLNRPWLMNDRWFRSYLSDLNQDDFPLSLRIAQAQESDAASMNKLQGQAMRRVAKRGWLTKVLKDQVVAIAQETGLPTDRMTIESIDKDITYSPGGPRFELRRGLENPEALELVARKQLIPLTFEVQTEEITKSRPPVKENRTNALDAIQTDRAGLDEDKPVIWDEFLQEPIGPFNGVVTPFSLASLAAGQVGHGYHEKMKSHFVVPKRLETQALQNPGARVETYEERANLPMDIVIRLDLSEVIPPNAIKINPRADEVFVPKARDADDYEDED